jgi:S1-C subfamily serine protease
MDAAIAKKTGVWIGARRVASGVVAVLTVALVTGCGVYGAAMTRSQRVLRERRGPSLAELERSEPERGRAIRKAVSRTGLLLEHAKEASVAGLLTEHEMKFEVSWKNEARGALSAAVPITRDGYFLTAAHCVNMESLTLVAFDAKRRLVNLPARVVWKGEEADLALVHAEMRPLEPFGLADGSALTAGTRVVIAGWSGAIKNTAPPLAAGRVRQVSGWRREKSGAAIWCDVEHDAPLNQGDSGGPLLTLDGGLVGINSQLGFEFGGMWRALLGIAGPLEEPFAGYNGLAVCPDAGWVMRMVEADRARVR